MSQRFTTNYLSIVEKIEAIDPIAYGKTRNYIDGDITYLSPYISRGVISTKQVVESVLARGYRVNEIESFIKECAWRDYFQRVAQVKNVSQSIKQEQFPVLNYGIPKVIVNANTGIEGIDTAIQQLYETGYMHNHCRMHTASVVCNIAQSYWHIPSQWMYYHLLDGDWASNACSWQWVAGANSFKKYYANQENINRYTHTKQAGTFLDTSYEELTSMTVPQVLVETIIPQLQTNVAALILQEANDSQLNIAAAALDQTDLINTNTSIQLDDCLPTFVYNYYNLNPNWHANELGNRVLLLEPSFFAEYPVSEKCIEFMLGLCKNIGEIQLFVGSFAALAQQVNPRTIYYKEHPLNKGYMGIEEPRDWIAEKITGYAPSFFNYWKKIEPQVYQLSKKYGQ